MAAVGTARTIWNGQTGAWKETGEREYTVIREVEVSDPLDGPAVVLGALGVGLLGASYAVGNDVDLLALLREKTPTRAPNTRLLWIVNERYSNRSDQDQNPQVNDDGDPEKDPEKWHDELDVSFRNIMRPVYKAKNRSPLNARPLGTNGPVVNSALAVLDPPLEREQPIMVVRVVRRRKKFPTADAKAYEGAINDDAFNINKPKLGFNLAVGQYQAKMEGITGSLQFLTDQDGKSKPFWKYGYELHIDDEFGWRVDVLDRGFHARACALDPNGRGGTISPSDLIAGQPQVRRLVDNAGIPITEAVLLDGNGQPLLPGLPAVYLTYSVARELPFAGLGI